MISAAFAILLLPTLALAEDAYDQPPISYSTTQPHDPVQALRARLAAGQAKLDYSRDRGFLESILKDLNVPASSQTLVFSKTSFQRDRISPQNPRAIYFNDDTYVGYVPGGRDVEIATTDPGIGTVFYTIKQQRVPAATQPSGASSLLVRETDNCLLCHAGSFTHDIPGLMIRSIFPDSSGNPILPAGTFVTTQESPIADRWGGWIVTGIDGGKPGIANAGMANALFDSAAEQSNDPPADRFTDQSAHRVAQVTLQNPTDYLSPRSDAVALLVLAHQTEAHNAFTRAVYATKMALRDEKVVAEALNEKLSRGEHSDSTIDRVNHACKPLVEYLLFCNEAALPNGIESNSPFVTDFLARGPRDPQGRSLRDFDLHHRLFKYPCSYLIYSASFDELPALTKSTVYQQFWDVLTGKDRDKNFAHLSTADRQAILEILRATKSNLPAYWHS